MSDDLLERGTRAMMQSEPWSSFWGRADAEKLARATIAFALEEAARACRRVADVAARKGRDYVVDGLIPEARLQAGRVEGADDCAAAIRALIPKEAK